jgi:hypothetical protein
VNEVGKIRGIKKVLKGTKGSTRLRRRVKNGSMLKCTDVPKVMKTQMQWRGTIVKIAEAFWGENEFDSGWRMR